MTGYSWNVVYSSIGITLMPNKETEIITDDEDIKKAAEKASANVLDANRFVKSIEYKGEVIK